MAINPWTWTRFLLTQRVWDLQRWRLSRGERHRVDTLQGRKRSSR